MSMNDTYQPINCDDYDNLELACQHHLVLTLALKDGETAAGKGQRSYLAKKYRVSGGRTRRQRPRAAPG